MRAMAWGPVRRPSRSVAVLVSTSPSTPRARATATISPRWPGPGAGAGQAQAVDDGPVRRQAERPGLRVARRRPRADGADLDEAEADGLPERDEARVLVHAGGEAHGVVEEQAQAALRQRRVPQRE